MLIHTLCSVIAGSPLQCWDNSTRGLDSATALEFVRTLRTSTELTGATAIVTLYQASQSIYDVSLTIPESLLDSRSKVFDKVAILYEGRQIYFGDIHAAKTFFINLGFECPSRQTTADFLTSLTNPAERVVCRGFRGKIPSTPDEFAAAWQESEDRKRLLQEIDEFDCQYPIEGPSLDKFKQSRKALQARSQYVEALLSTRAHTDSRQTRTIAVHPVGSNAGQIVYGARLPKAKGGYGCHYHGYHFQRNYGARYWQCVLQLAQRNWCSLQPWGFTLLRGVVGSFC